MEPPITFSINDIMPVLIEAIEHGKTFKLPISGDSMLPFLVPFRDAVTLVKPHISELRRGDIVLYKRDNNQLVLHRVIKRSPDNTFLMNGDSQLSTEHITEDQIIAVATVLNRNNKQISRTQLPYRFISRLWITLRPFRRFIGLRSNEGRVKLRLKR